jgi:hypothetical protein
MKKPLMSFWFIVFLLVSVFVVSANQTEDEGMDVISLNPKKNMISEDTEQSKRELIKVINKEEKSSSEGRSISILYVFDPSILIGESVAVDIWLVGKSGDEVARSTDGPFSINVDGVIERNVSMSIPYNLSGNYDLYLAPSFDSGDFIKTSLSLEGGSRPVTGRVVLGQTKGKAIAYGVFLLILIIFVIYRIRDQYKTRQENKILSRKMG